MQKLQSIGIAVAMLCSLFLFGMVNSSQAREIIDFPSDTEDTSYGGYTYHMAYLKTDVPFYCVWWYVNGKYGTQDGAMAVIKKLKPTSILTIKYPVSLKARSGQSRQKLHGLRMTAPHTLLPLPTQ